MEPAKVFFTYEVLNGGFLEPGMFLRFKIEILGAWDVEADGKYYDPEMGYRMNVSGVWDGMLV